ncbi:MAG: SpoIIE family protein phosphatase [Candidatus Latescibacterota bacterium]|nr:MAG: SpoIIE family protein phosphatase [Candidatus Latescibacterota bacterium]
MPLLIFVETMLILAAVALIWRRARAMKPPYEPAVLSIGLALGAQGAVLILLSLLLEWLKADPAVITERLPATLWAVWLMQLVRTVFLLLALGAWLRIVKPSLGRVTATLLILGTVGILFTPRPLDLASFVAVVVAFGRLQWDQSIRGARRLGLFAASFLLLLLLSVDISGYVTQNDVDKVGDLSNMPPLSLVAGPLLDPAPAAHVLASPWNWTIRILILFFRLQLLVVFVRLLVVRISLRGFSLKRRMIFTLALYRLIPGTLAIAAALLGLYFGTGVHKTRMIQTELDDTIERNLHGAGMVIDQLSGYGTVLESDALRGVMSDAQRWLDPDAPSSHIVMRQFDITGHVTGIDRRHATTDTVLVAKMATPMTPDTLLVLAGFESLATDSMSAGLIETNGALYLTASRTRVGTERITRAEIYTPLDSLLLKRLALRVGVDVFVEVNPKVYISPTIFIGVGDSAWSDTTYTVSASSETDREATGLWRGTRYFARKFFPLGNWLEPPSPKPVGAVTLTLKTSLERFVDSLTAGRFFLSTNMAVILTLSVILLMFIFAELSAVRTGRNVAQGILDDVENLAAAARRIGDGELDHRVPVQGDDELSTLAQSFNTMAANLKQHQQALLEKERLEADLAVARQIQQRLLPQEAPMIPGLDVTGVSFPSREVGGDLFHFLPLPDGRLGLAIGDVSGKSIPAALLMSNTLAAFRAESRLYSDEDRVLTRMNQLIADQVEPGRFVTFFYGVVEPREKRIRYACAGHNPPLKINAKGESEWLGSTGLPLGVIADSEYSSSVLAFDIGDVIVLYSDGVTEAHGTRTGDSWATPDPLPKPIEHDGDHDPDNEEFFGEERLAATVRSLRHDSAAEITDGIIGAIRHFTDGAPASDDLTLVVVKYTGETNAGPSNSEAK